MRIRKQKEGLTVNVIAGTHVVFFGLSLKQANCQGLRGFAFRRLDAKTGETIWLRGMKTFQHTEPHPAITETFSTQEHPVQSFQWADYSAKPGEQYTYWVVAQFGTPGALESRFEVKLDVTTETEPSLQASLETWPTHTAFFNRGSVATQEYARRFQNFKPSDPRAGAGAYEWLSRGLLEALLDFIAQAKEGWELHGAVYEFQWPDVLKKLKEISDNGATVNVIYDDIEKFPDGKPKGTSLANRKAIAEAKIESLCIPRQHGTLMHNKFFVLSNNGNPQAVWTGSTNITENGIFGHANVGHVVKDEAIAAQYLKYWQRLRADPEPKDLNSYRQENMTATPIPPEGDWTTAAIFSPRDTALDSLTWYAELAGRAKDAVLMTFAFGMDKRFKEVYGQDDAVLRMGLLEKASNASKAETRAADKQALLEIRKRPNVLLAFGNRIKTNSFDRWLAEIDRIISHVNVYWIHTKFMLLDPLSKHPTVVTGSANFSEASTKTNDENMLVIKDNLAITDIYFGEYMRLYSHYAFREAVQRAQDKAQQTGTPIAWKPNFLREDDWWDSSFDEQGGDARCARRRYFADVTD